MNHASFNHASHQSPPERSHARLSGEEPKGSSRLQEALADLNAAINDLVAAENNLAARLAGVVRPAAPASDSRGVGSGDPVVVSSPVVDQINATRQRIGNIVAALNDTLQRLEA